MQNYWECSNLWDTVQTPGWNHQNSLAASEWKCFKSWTCKFDEFCEAPEGCTSGMAVLIIRQWTWTWDQFSQRVLSHLTHSLLYFFSCQRRTMATTWSRGISSSQIRLKARGWTCDPRWEIWPPSVFSIPCRCAWPLDTWSQRQTGIQVNTEL